MDLQLRETSQLTGADWAVWLERGDDWEMLASYKLGVKQREAVLAYARQKAVRGWLNGALTGKRFRSRRISPDAG